jgi:hypothetical protein
MNMVVIGVSYDSRIGLCSEWGTAHRLAIGAVAERRRFRIGFGFE